MILDSEPEIPFVLEVASELMYPPVKNTVDNRTPSADIDTTVPSLRLGNNTEIAELD
jgi:hypothetical protein